MIYDEIVREKQFQKNISPSDKKFYSDSCNKINQYAREQNTFYDSANNLMLYGINSNMNVLGVSDGTCNQINPYIYTQNNKCGLGSAGGNRCFKNKILENFDYDKNTGICKTCNVTEIVILLLLLIFLLSVLYAKKNSNYSKFLI